jgi:hypothetical protein
MDTAVGPTGSGLALPNGSGRGYSGYRASSRRWCSKGADGTIPGECWCHLQRIYEKTGMSRSPSLHDLLLALAPAVRL